MTKEEREALYDAEIAPMLLALAQKCEAAGMSFVAHVEWGPQSAGSTVKLQDAAGPGSRLAAFAARCNGNADNLFMMVMSDAAKHGHNSIYVHMLEQKLKPAAHAASIS